MPLSPEQEQRLRALATEKGLDPDRAVKIANAPMPSAGKGAASAPPPEIKIFQYHLPFMRVRELRSYLQLTESIADEDLLCGEFLAKHGGVLSGAPAKSDEPAPTE